MRRILFLFLSLTLLIACSSDDNHIIIKEQALTLQASQQQIVAGQSVEFKVTTAKQENVKDFILLCNNNPISSPYVFTKAGKYSIVARKKGYRDSDPIEVVVKDKVELSLVLTTENTSVGLNDVISFVVTDNDGNHIEGVKIYNKTSQENLENSSYHAKELGSFTFIAKAENYKDSQELTIDVKSVFIVNSRAYSLDVFLVSIEVEKVLDTKTGYLKQVDKVVYLNDATPCNIFTYYFLSGEDNKVNLLAIDFLVANPTIKVKDKKVVDYGQRILPSKVDNISVSRVIGIVGDDTFIEGDFGGASNKLGEYDLKIDRFSVQGNGVGAGLDGVLGFGDLFMDYNNIESNFNVRHQGEFLFIEFDQEEIVKYHTDIIAIKQLIESKF